MTPAPSDIFAADLTTRHRARAAYRSDVFETIEDAFLGADPDAELATTRQGLRHVQRLRQLFESMCDEADQT